MNTQSITDIANLALAHCGVSKPIANLELEKSLAAQMIRTFVPIARQKVLRDFPFMFATKQISPALTATQPTPEWLYAYQYPNDAMKITRFMSWRLQNDTRQSRVPYTIMKPVTNDLSPLSPQPSPYVSTGLWIYTNWPGYANSQLPVIIEYTFDNDNIAEWTPDFVMAYSYMLASYIVASVTSNNPDQMKAQLTQFYAQALSEARAMSGNEEQRPQEPQSEFIRARDGEYGSLYPGQAWNASASGFIVE